MRPPAMVALAGASIFWLLRRRRKPVQRGALDAASSSLPPSAALVSPPPPLPPPPPRAQPAGPPPPPPAKSASRAAVLGAVLQWIFLVLLGSALTLTAARGAWDVFGVLSVAAAFQLAGQLARSVGSSSRRGNGANGSGGRGRWGRGAAADAPAAPPPVAFRPDPRIAGVWIKDGPRSDSMDAAASAMQLNPLVRTAVRLIRGMELAGLEAGRFDMAIFSIIAWFKVRERYQLDGTVAHFNRRDLRRGKHAASVAVQPDGSVVLAVSWGQPLGGNGTDHFQLLPGQGAGGADGGRQAAGAEGSGGGAGAPRAGDVLVVTSVIRLAAVAGGTAPAAVTYRTVYVRAGRGRHGADPPEEGTQQQ